MSVSSAAGWTARQAREHKVVSGSIAVFAAAIIAVSVLTSSSSAAPSAPVAPGFSVTALGASGKLSLSQYTGKPVIVNFWASWCGPCQQETPLLASWYKQEQGRIALIGLDENDTTAKALAFAHAKGVTYTLGFDPQLTLTGPYGVDGLPQTFFLNAQHRIVEHVLGAMTKADLAQGVSLMNASGTPSEKTICSRDRTMRKRLRSTLSARRPPTTGRTRVGPNWAKGRTWSISSPEDTPQPGTTQVRSRWTRAVRRVLLMVRPWWETALMSPARW